MIYCECFGYPTSTSMKQIISNYLYKTSTIITLDISSVFIHQMSTTPGMSGSALFGYIFDGSEMKRLIIGVHR